MISKPSVYPTDSYGLPGTLQSNDSISGGDSAAIYGTILVLTKRGKVEPEFINKNKLYWSQTYNQPLRHPDTGPNRFSRDQMIPMICTGLRHPLLPFVKKLYLAHKSRLFLYAWNTKNNDGKSKIADPTLFQVWALWLRYKKPFWARLLLAAFDLEHLVGSIRWRFFMPDIKAEGARVTRNHMLIAIASNRHMPTFVSRLSYKLTPFPELLDRWEAHCQAVEEYQTADLFRTALGLETK